MSPDTPRDTPVSDGTPDLGRAEQLAPDDLLEAALDDLRRRWRRGERGGAAAYPARYPALRTDQAVAALLYQEFVLRGEAGEDVSFDGYLGQFPQHAVLLRHLRQADELVEQALFPPAALPGRRVGEYELLEEIGRGGMGVVYRAGQVSLGRVVALKMILAGKLASPGDLERFRNEARAAARLQHPGIVAIHEVGAWQGQPFFSMDLVEGPTLAAVIREHPLPAPQAARYVEAVARAVQHAHEHGVLHRDLKPANVLIDQEDRPRVTDFGLARQATGDRCLTGTGQVLGTPSYMPPEQASDQHGAVGPASDVYSLGAILYELLTGRPPFQAGTPAETLLLMLGNDPVPPRRLNPGVPRDLETICLKCLEKDSGRRYPSAAALADDLGRFQRGEPVRARPVAPIVRGWRWCLRAVASLLAAVVLLVVIGLSASLSLWRRAEREKVAAKAEWGRAEANLDMADEAVERMLRHIAQVRLARVPQATPVRRDVLLEAIDLYQSLLRQKSADPKLRARVATIHAELSHVQASLGQTDEALASLDEAVNVWQGLSDEFPDRLDYWRSVASCQAERALLLGRGRQVEQAERAWQAAEGILQRLVKEHGAQPPDRCALALLHLGRCDWLNMLWRYPDSEARARQSLELLGPLMAEFPEEKRYRSVAASAHNNLAIAFKETKRRQEAREQYETSLVLVEQLHAADPGDSDTKAALGTAHRNLAILLRGDQEIDGARQHYDKARGLFEELATEFPDVIPYHAELAEVHHGLANCAVEEGAAQDRRDHLRLAVKHQRATLAADPHHRFYRYKMSHRLIPFGDIQIQLGEHQEAAEALFEARLFMTEPRPCADAVRGLVACADLAEKDDRLSPARRAQLAERYAGQAVEVLRAGAREGMVQATDLKEMRLERLEGRADYGKLLAELGAIGGSR